MDKMEQALEPEDVLSCCLVLKHGHSSRHTGTELGWLQLAGSSQQNCQCQLELTAGNVGGGLNAAISPFQTPSSTHKVLWIHMSQGKAGHAAHADAAPMPELQHILCHIPGSLGLTEGFGASLLCPLTAPAAQGSWRMMCWYLAACSAVRQGREALVLLLSVLQPFEIKYCLCSFQIQAPSKSPQFSIPHQNHKAPRDSCIKIGNKLMQCLCSYA